MLLSVAVLNFGCVDLIGLTTVKDFLMGKESIKLGYFTQGYNMEEPFAGMQYASLCFFVK